MEEKCVIDKFPMREFVYGVVFVFFFQAFVIYGAKKYFFASVGMFTFDRETRRNAYEKLAPYIVVAALLGLYALEKCDGIKEKIREPLNHTIFTLPNSSRDIEYKK